MPDPTPVRFYFDYISSNAYLAWVRLPEIAERFGVALEPVPVLFAGLLGAHGQLGPAEVLPKALWMMRNTLRKAGQLGVPLRPPAFHPFNPLLALRVSSLPLPDPDRAALVTALFDAVWVRGLHVSEPAVVATLADEVGLDGSALVEAAGAPQAKARLRRQTDDAIAAGVFGVPTLGVGDELFWGYDDLPYLELFLAGQDPTDPAEAARWSRRLTPSAWRRQVPPRGAPRTRPADLGFAKYHGLGNDYLVFEEQALRGVDPAALARAVCDRHYGVGADGVLVGAPPDAEGRFGLRILNPDGSEAEKSGNGLRIFARYLFDAGRVGEAPFTVCTPGGDVGCRVAEAGRLVSVAMGRASFRSGDVPMTGPDREVLREPLDVDGEGLEISAVGLGNPHCVVFRDAVDAALVRRLGPRIERHPAFPRRTNVQLVERRDPGQLRIEIWERGAGYTLASGTSACAAAAVACRLGLARSPVRVEMPGGSLRIDVAPDGSLEMQGPAERIAEGSIAPDLLRKLA